MRGVSFQRIARRLASLRPAPLRAAVLLSCWQCPPLQPFGISSGEILDLVDSLDCTHDGILDYRARAHALAPPCSTVALPSCAALPVPASPTRLKPEAPRRLPVVRRRLPGLHREPQARARSGQAALAGETPLHLRAAGAAVPAAHHAAPLEPHADRRPQQAAGPPPTPRRPAANRAGACRTRVLTRAAPMPPLRTHARGCN